MADLNTSLQTIQNPFLFANYEVRTATDEHGEACFCAKDVFEALGIVWKERSGTLRKCPDKWICPCYLQGQSGSGEVIFISEPAVYQAAFSSRKPEAIRFTEWVCEEVLPAIRRQGYYGKVDLRQRLSFSKQITHVAEKLVSNRDAMIHQLLIRELHDLCNITGQPMPDLALFCKDRRQLPLEV